MWTVGQQRCAASRAAKVVLPEPEGPSTATMRVLPEEGSEDLTRSVRSEKAVVMSCPRASKTA